MADSQAPAIPADLPPALWEERLGELLGLMAKRHPESAPVVASMRENAMFRALLRLLARFHRRLEGEDGRSGGASDHDATLRSLLSMARETALRDEEIVDAWAMITLVSDVDLDRFVPPYEGPRHPFLAIAGLLVLALALGVGGYAVWNNLRHLGFWGAMALLGKIAALVLFLVWAGSRLGRAYFPKAIYAQSLTRLSELGCRVQGQVTLTPAYSSLAGFAIGVAIAAVVVVVWKSPFVATALGWSAFLASRQVFYPRPAEFRAWALKAIAARGGLFSRE